MKAKRSVRDILSGSSIFLHEYPMKGGWHCRILRSTIVRGRIAGILVDPEFISTGAILIQRKDISGLADLQIFDESLPILSGEDIHYFGQPVAMLVARNQETLNSTEKMVQIRYEEFPALPASLTDPQQIYRRVEKSVGNPGRMWEQSSESVESRYELGTRSDNRQDPMGCIAHWKGGELLLITPSIWPHLIANNLIAATGLEREKINIQPTNPGVIHDHLLVDGTLTALYAGIAADITGKNIRLEISEDERLLFGTRQPPISIRQRQGLDEDKQVLVNDVVVDVNIGAFSLFATEIINQIMSAAPGLYRSRAWRLRIHLYRSNLPPMSIFHGFPATLLQIPSEIQANRMAELLQESPLRWRLVNLLRAGDTAPPEYTLKADLDRSGVMLALDRMSDFERRHSSCELVRKRRVPGDIYSRLGSNSWQKGMGMAYGFQPSGFSRTLEKAIRSQVRIRMETDGMVHAFVNTAPGTSAAKLYIRRIIREELGVDNDVIQLHTSDCREVPDSGPVCLSRSLTVVLDVFRQACRKLQKQRFHNPLPLDVTSTIRMPRSSGWDQGEFRGDPFLYRSYAALAMEVDVDPITYIPEILEIWMVVDAPAVLNYNQARAALEGGIIQSIEWVRGWQGEFEGGVLQHGMTDSSRNRESLKVPKINIEFLKSSSPRRTGSISQTGFRDLPHALVPSAYLSALSQATGFYFDSIPSDSQTVFRYIHTGEDDEDTD